jgi:CRP/FNR family cyclic AMP-dependent transcriptional regulator
VTSTTEINLFRHADQFESVAADTCIFRAGDPGDLMYAVREGEVDLVVDGAHVETVGPGGIFGEMALIEHDVRSATAMTRTACELVPIDERRFTFLVQQNPFFAMSVFKVLARRLRQMNHAPRT